MRTPEIFTPLLTAIALLAAAPQLSGCNSAPLPPRELAASKSPEIDATRTMVRGRVAAPAIVENPLAKLLDEPRTDLPISLPQGAEMCIDPALATVTPDTPGEARKPTKEPDKKSPALETGKGGEALKKILEAYEYVLGPGRNKAEFYYIDIPNLFTPYGPFPDEKDRSDRGAFHDENRQKIAGKNPKCHVDTYRDLPVPAAVGIPSQRFERKYARANADYKGRPLIEQFGTYFDRHYDKSQLKKLLQKAGQERYFRDLVIYGLIGVESGWNPQMQTPAGRDGKGHSIYAKGLAQAVDHTQRHMERKGSLQKGLNPFVPEDAAEYCVALLENNLRYLAEAVGKDSFLFQGQNVKSLLIPLLLTSYNQGHGRLVRMAQYFIQLHNSGTIPDNYYEASAKPSYVDQVPSFKSDTIVWFLARAFTVVRTGQAPKSPTWVDSQFRARNSGFGPDGAQYAFKVLALSETFIRASKKP